MRSGGLLFFTSTVVSNRKHTYIQVMFRTFAIFSAALWIAAPNAWGAPRSNQAAMIFLPPGAAYCRDFLRLEPMQKYDSGTLPIRDGEAEDYFTYRGIEEWVRGFVTASNILGARNSSGDATGGKDLYELMPKLFEYCRSHQNDIFSDAAQQFLSTPHASGIGSQ